MEILASLKQFGATSRETAMGPPPKSTNGTSGPSGIAPATNTNQCIHFSFQFVFGRDHLDFKNNKRTIAITLHGPGTSRSHWPFTANARNPADANKPSRSADSQRIGSEGQSDTKKDVPPRRTKDELGRARVANFRSCLKIFSGKRDKCKIMCSFGSPFFFCIVHSQHQGVYTLNSLSKSSTQTSQGHTHAGHAIKSQATCCCGHLPNLLWLAFGQTSNSPPLSLAQPQSTWIPPH